MKFAVVAVKFFQFFYGYNSKTKENVNYYYKKIRESSKATRTKIIHLLTALLLPLFGYHTVNTAEKFSKNHYIIPEAPTR